MIYLSARDKNAYGEETFWVWFLNNFENSDFGIPATLTKEDAVLRYSLMGAFNAAPAKMLALSWELLPEMKVVLKSGAWDAKINASYKTAQSADRVTAASRFSIPFYEKYSKTGRVDILPIGVDTELFKPYSDDEKHALKVRYGVPLDKEIGFWCGTTHEIKGYRRMQQYAMENPDIFWVIVWYPSAGMFVGHGKQYVMVNQPTMAEIMNLADFQLYAGILRPYYIVEYEGMAANLKQRNISGLEKDFEVGENPREAIFEHKWDRITAKGVWEDYINDMINN